MCQPVLMKVYNFGIIKPLKIWQQESQKIESKLNSYCDWTYPYLGVNKPGSFCVPDILPEGNF